MTALDSVSSSPLPLGLELVAEASRSRAGRLEGGRRQSAQPVVLSGLPGRDKFDGAGRSRTASLRALDNSKLIEMGRDDFNRLLQRRPAVVTQRERAGLRRD
jgi:hypothetical protein